MPTRTDCQRLVEDIQNMMSSETRVQDGELNGLAADYMVASEEANQRLRECDELLRKGLRGEAIQRCEVEPNLLDLVAVLDFAERPQWCEWLGMLALAVPPPLLMDAAAELNAAYAQEQPLTALMRRHRLLALARAPLGDRIAVLRQIAQADAANIIWDDDLRGYETHRHKQMHTEAEAALRSRDVPALGRLEEELRSPWRSPPPPALVQRVVLSATRLRADAARVEMTEIEPRLTEAFSDFDVARARPLRSRWKACAALADLPDNDPLVELVAPALEWLAEQDRRDQAAVAYEKALADLGQALDADRSRHDLERIYHRLVQCERGVPDVLDRRYHERMAALSLGESRRAKLLYAAMAATVLVTAGLTVFWISHQLRETEVADAAASLHGLLDELKLSEAQKYLETLGADKSWLQQRPEIEELEARLQGLVKDEADRRAAFRAAVAGVREAGFERPDQKTLEEARRLAKTPTEETEVLKLDRQIAARQRELQDERNQAFMVRVEDLRKRLEEFEADRGNDPEKRLAAAAQLRRDAADLAADPNGAEAFLIGNVKAIEARLVTTYETQALEIRQLRHVERINAAIGQRDRFRRVLGEYIESFPGGKRAGDFQKVLDADLSLDEHLAKWSALDATFARLEPHSIRSEVAAARIADAKTLLAEFPDGPQADLIRQRLALLEPIARRGTGAARIDGPLKEMLRFPTIAGLTMLMTGSGARYYTDEQVRKIGSKFTINYLADFKLAKLSDTVEGSLMEAPQSALSRVALDELAKMNDPHWEATFCRIMGQVRDERLLDPILKVQLLTQILGVARAGSLVLEQAYAKHAELLDDSGIDGTVNWLDPDDKKAMAARKQAQDLLNRLPDFHAARDAAVKEYARLRKPWAPIEYHWIGWLLFTDAGKWTCSSHAAPEEWSGDLVLITGEGQPPKVKLTTVGHLTKGRIEITASDPDLLEGWPVYAAVADQRSK